MSFTIIPTGQFPQYPQFVSTSHNIISKPIFGNNYEQKSYAPEDHSTRNTILIGGAIFAAAIGAYFLLHKGNTKGLKKAGETLGGVKPPKEPPTVPKNISLTGAQDVHSATKGNTKNLEKSVDEFSVQEIADKFKIKNYSQSSELSEINGLVYKKGKRYSGKVIYPASEGGYFPPEVCKYKDGKMISKHTIYDNKISSKIEIKDKYSGRQWKISDDGKMKISRRYRSSSISDAYNKTEYISARRIENLTCHNYSEIPDISVNSRARHTDFLTYRMTEKPIVDYNHVLNKISYQELRDAGKTILAIGKDSSGKKIVFLQARAGRIDNCGRPVRNYIILSSQNEKFLPAQIDLIKAISGKSQEVLAREIPLASSISVRPSLINETINIDTNTMLNEIAHWSKDRTMQQVAQDALRQLETMPNDSYIKLVG